MTLIRKLSDNGQAILCTIHQPSAILFQQFDRLLLLAHGGNTVYFGDLGQDSRLLVDYFERQGAEPCAQDENPADWMLKAIGAAPGSKATRDWPQAWKQSPEFEKMQSELNHLSQISHSPERGSTFSVNATPYASSLQVQLLACIQRVFQQYWRSPSYIYAKMVLSVGTVLISQCKGMSVSL